jgi:hypothetical protein
MPLRRRVDSKASQDAALLRAARYYNAPWFVAKDPVSIPGDMPGVILWISK